MTRTYNNNHPDTNTNAKAKSSTLQNSNDVKGGRDSRVFEYLTQVPRIIDRDEMFIAIANDTNTIIVHLVDDRWTESGHDIDPSGSHDGLSSCRVQGEI